MNFHDKKVIPPKYIYLFLCVICLILLFLSVIFESRFSPLKAVTSAIITPMQNGVNTVGVTLHNSVTDHKDKQALIEENKELLEKIDEYSAKSKLYEQENYELKRLQELLDLQERYADYKTIGARVIATDSTNWFYTFVIDKGSKDGVKVGCNILADGGLAGIVIEVGDEYSKVRSIIDDNSNISASISGKDSLCTVSGDVSSMKEGYIHVEYINKAEEIEEGAEIITSHVSNKFLPGLLIGYITDVVVDSNNLTQSAKCLPVVDFSNLQEVLVVMDLKTTYKTDSTSKNIYDGVTGNNNSSTESDTSDSENSEDADSSSSGDDASEENADDEDLNDTLPEEPAADPEPQEEE